MNGNLQSLSFWVCLILLGMIISSFSYFPSSNIVFFLLRTHEKDPGSVPRAYMVTLTIHFRDSGAFFWPLQGTGTYMAHTNTCRQSMHTQKEISKTKTKFCFLIQFCFWESTLEKYSKIEKKKLMHNDIHEAMFMV